MQKLAFIILIQQTLVHPGKRVEQKVDYMTAGILKSSRMVQSIYSNFLKEQNTMTTTTMQDSYDGFSRLFQICPQLETLQEFNFLLFWSKPHLGSMMDFGSIEFKGEINPLPVDSERPNYNSALW